MLNIHNKSAQTGFSLIELMVGVVILGILAAVAVPSFQIWMQNSEIRNAAESISSGLQRARAEAVSRNINVDFVVAADSSWTIQPTAGGAAIATRRISDGSRNVIVAPVGSVTFNSLGGVVAGFTQVDVDSTVLAAADSNNLRITLGIGGNIRLCDPNVSTGLRACI